MNPEKVDYARALVYAMRASGRTDWGVSERLANQVLELADEVERLREELERIDPHPRRANADLGPE